MFALFEMAHGKAEFWGATQDGAGAGEDVIIPYDPAIMAAAHQAFIAAKSASPASKEVVIPYDQNILEAAQAAIGR